MLVMRGEAAVCRAYGPAVATQQNASRARRNDGLNRNDQTFRQQVARGKLRVVGHARLFMNSAADAVSTQLRNDVKPAAPDFALHSPSDIARFITNPRRIQRLPERPLNAMGQGARLLGNGWHLYG